MNKNYKKQHKVTKKSLENLKPFSKDYQPSNEAKSRGQINRSIDRNIIVNLRTKILENTTILDNLVHGIDKEIRQGKLDNALNLLKIIKEPEVPVQSVNNVGINQINYKEPISIEKLKELKRQIEEDE